MKTFKITIIIFSVRILIRPLMWYLFNHKTIKWYEARKDFIDVHPSKHKGYDASGRYARQLRSRCRLKILCLVIFYNKWELNTDLALIYPSGYNYKQDSQWVFKFEELEATGFLHE